MRVDSSVVVAHAIATDRDLLIVVMVTAALVSGLVMALGLAALARRRSWSFFLVTLALATLLLRSLFGVLAIQGFLWPPSHHLFEHGLDVLAVLLLLGAVYVARTGEPTEIDP